MLEIDSKWALILDMDFYASFRSWLINGMEQKLVNYKGMKMNENFLNKRNGWKKRMKRN